MTKQQEVILRLEKGPLFIDGGNPEAPLWICAIEYGMEKKGGIKKLKKDFDNTGLKRKPIPNWDKESPQFFEAIAKQPHHRDVAKMLMGYLDKRAEDWSSYIKAGGYGRSKGDFFKLNLFPVRANGQKQWLRKHAELTGFKNRATYSYWARRNYFPRLRELVKEYKPKIVLGTGIGCCVDFLDVFGADDCRCDFVKQGPLMVWKFNKLKRAVVVSRFLSRWSTKDLVKLGKKLKNLLKPQ
ncbi:MAG TPA: hypothetical protein PK590_03655 [Candidatus Omnitrophota bacterium]|nr:hypothetical protein [Candidatus Omnitrophota bacterium]